MQPFRASKKARTAAIRDENTVDNNEIMLRLCNPTAADRCRLGLADCLLYDNNQVKQWCITSSTGEVEVKTDLNLGKIYRRWAKIANQLTTSYIAVVKQREDSLTTFLPSNHFTSFESLESFSNISSVHCFLGCDNSPIIYRCRYLDGNVSTYFYSLPLQSEPFQLQEKINDAGESNLSLSISQANSINRVTEKATVTIVQYLERDFQSPLRQIEVDYVIDSKSQIWMLWSSNAVLKDHRLLVREEEGEREVLSGSTKSAGGKERTETKLSSFETDQRTDGEAPIRDRKSAREGKLPDAENEPGLVNAEDWITVSRAVRHKSRPNKTECGDDDEKEEEIAMEEAVVEERDLLRQDVLVESRKGASTGKRPRRRDCEDEYEEEPSSLHRRGTKRFTKNFVRSVSSLAIINTATMVKVLPKETEREVQV